jgi:hypothetical protein
MVYIIPEFILECHINIHLPMMIQSQSSNEKNKSHFFKV